MRLGMETRLAKPVVLTKFRVDNQKSVLYSLKLPLFVLLQFHEFKTQISATEEFRSSLVYFLFQSVILKLSGCFDVRLDFDFFSPRQEPLPICIWGFAFEPQTGF